jgi:hypothetical protein
MRRNLRSEIRLRSSGTAIYVKLRHGALLLRKLEGQWKVVSVSAARSYGPS